MAIKKIFILFFFVSLVTIFTIYNFSNVDKELTNDDKIAIRSMGLDVVCKELYSFEKEMRCIHAIQKAVYFNVEVGLGIKENFEREPKNLLAEKKGLCYDRSRFIEKILRFFDFETRHVSIYYTQTQSLSILLNRKAKSHAFSEVLTSKGWLVVDSIEDFIAISKEKKLYTASAIREIKDRKNSMIFNTPIPKDMYKNYIIIYGLYSRHGKFYPPFNRIPDINWYEFIKYNIF